jgi:predicted Zn-dependent protease with MMP-like domain
MLHIPAVRRNMNHMKRMSRREFEAIVADAVASLPETAKAYLHNIVVDVEDEPDEETLREVGFTEEEIADGQSLYGLFAPFELPSPWAGDVVDIRSLPHRIIIYKWPLEEAFPDRDELIDEIRKTVLHELHHHFGYSERDISTWTDLE